MRLFCPTIYVVYHTSKLERRSITTEWLLGWRLESGFFFFWKFPKCANNPWSTLVKTQNIFLRSNANGISIQLFRLVKLSNIFGSRVHFWRQAVSNWKVLLMMKSDRPIWNWAKIWWNSLSVISNQFLRWNSTFIHSPMVSVLAKDCAYAP